MRAPRPSLISDVEALEVVNVTLDRQRDEELARALARGRNEQGQEARAIVAAQEYDDWRALAALLRSGKAGPEAMALAADHCDGTVKPKRGPRRRAGLLWRTKSYHAALDIADIQKILAVSYPMVPATREWAIAIAAMRWGIDQNTFRNFLKSRRRP